MSLRYKKDSRRRDRERRQLRKEKTEQVVLEDCREQDALDEEAADINKYYLSQMFSYERYMNEAKMSFLERCKDGDYKHFFSYPPHPAITIDVLKEGIELLMCQRPLNLSHVVMANYIQQMLNRRC